MSTGTRTVCILLSDIVPCKTCFSKIGIGTSSLSAELVKEANGCIITVHVSETSLKFRDDFCNNIQPCPE